MIKYLLIFLLFLPLLATPAPYVDAINSERAAVAAPPVAYNVALTASAQRWAEAMERCDTLSHTLPRECYPGFQSLVLRTWAGAREAGYQVWHAQDILAGPGSDDYRIAVSSWLASPDHAAAMLRPSFSQIGCARAGEYHACILIGDGPFLP